MQLVTIAVFPTAFSAYVVQGRLQADGIECYVQDEHTLQINPLLSNALGGIKLQVKDTDVPAAVALMHQTGYRTVFDAIPGIHKKQPHILIQFIKFIGAAALLLGWLYLTDFKGKM